MFNEALVLARIIKVRTRIELTVLSKRLERRKRPHAQFLGLSPCGMKSRWHGLIHGNVWERDLYETRVLASIGARSPVNPPASFPWTTPNVAVQS